jgi:hypothetical protein
MKRRLLYAGALALAAASAALAADLPLLRGDRFKPLTYQELGPEQKTLVEALLAGPRTSLNGPFNVMLRSPDLGDRLQRVGLEGQAASSRALGGEGRSGRVGKLGSLRAAQDHPTAAV